MKILLIATLSSSLLAAAGAAGAHDLSAIRAARSFDYYDRNGVEHTGVVLTLADVSRHVASDARRWWLYSPPPKAGG